jgi:transposase InsO family protein
MIVQERYQVNGLKEKGVDVLDVLEDYIVENGKPEKVMHDNGKQFTSKIFRRFLKKNNIKDKSIPARYPQLQGKLKHITRL